ncbi:hypothetical protein MAM1_0057c03662 [Mucor ambiguus]|uniref:Secreted protein n=1 Tax=Mucor ambiguus TaxID=91626 RepID=A0A0C9MM47_9FUNG|nr:hypothetical protein MAM1_0057c03662 [Mucor ambiguus]
MQIKLLLSIIPLVCLFGVALAAPVNEIQARDIGDAVGDGALDDGVLDDGLLDDGLLDDGLLDDGLLDDGLLDDDLLDDGIFN